jgi:hypothetical protein
MEIQIEVVVVEWEGKEDSAGGFIMDPITEDRTMEGRIMEDRIMEDRIMEDHITEGIDDY